MHSRYRKCVGALMVVTLFAPPRAISAAEAETRAVVDGREVVLGLEQTPSVARAAAVATESLSRRAAAVAPDAPLELVVWLKSRPAPRLARELRAQARPQLEGLAERAREIHRAARPQESLPPVEERRFTARFRSLAETLTPEQRDALRNLNAEAEAITASAQRELQRRVREEIRGEQERAAGRIAALGGRIKARIYSQNALQIELPARALEPLLAEPFVAQVIEHVPGAPELDNQDASLGLTGGFWANAVDGGIWDAGVLDDGVDTAHPAFAGLTFLDNFGVQGGHGTGVAGIIASGDATYRGMAFGLNSMLVGSASNSLAHADWMVSTAVDDPEAMNLSWNQGLATDGDYTAIDQFWDGLVDDHSVLLCKSTGNQGNGTTTITHPAPAYNAIAVANMNDQNTVTRTDDVITSSSSRGPTLGGRKKPDISAPGNQTMSTSNGWETGADFANIGGTSAAAPHITGATVLLSDLRSNDNPAANKAVLINTADAWTDNGTSGDTSDDGLVSGSLWNKTYGWGYVDLWEAWYNGTDVFTSAIDDGVTPSGPDFKLYKGPMWAGEKATLTWHRHVGYDGSNYPSSIESLTNLDLIAYNAGTGAPIDSSLSNIDNVEQVAVAATGEVVLKVDVWGTIDPQVGVESYALATEENFVVATPPSFTLTSSVSSTSFLGRLLTISVRNNGTVTAFNNQVSVSGFFSGSSSLGSLAPGETKTATFSRTCSFGAGAQSSSFSNTSSSYGESFSASGAASASCPGIIPF
jgi:serine protease AprX